MVHLLAWLTYEEDGGWRWVIVLILAQVMPVDFLRILVPPLVTVYQRQFMTGEPRVLSLCLHPGCGLASITKLTALRSSRNRAARLFG